MERDSFIIYRSFYEALKNLDKETIADVFLAICECSLNFKKNIKLDGLAKNIFLLIEPQLIANNIKYNNGKKGGRPEKNWDNSQKPKPNLNVTETKPNHNLMYNVECRMKNDIHTCPSEKKKTDISKKKKPQYSQEFEEIWRTYPQNGGKKQEMFKAWNEYSEEDHTAFLFGAKLLCLYRNYIRYGETRMSQRIDRWMEGYVKPEDRKADLIKSIGQINSIQDEELRQKALDRAKELFGEDYVRGALIKASGKISLDLH